MNTHDQDPHKDNDAVSAVYRQASHDEPPSVLDDAIRAAARRAVHARPQPLKTSFMKRWQMPLATAASVMLAVSVLLVSLDQEPALVKNPMSASSKEESMTVQEKPVDIPKERAAPALAASSSNAPIVESVMSQQQPAPAPKLSIPVAPVLPASPTIAPIESRRDAAAPAPQALAEVAKEATVTVEATKREAAPAFSRPSAAAEARNVLQDQTQAKVASAASAPPPAVVAQAVAAAAAPPPPTAAETADRYALAKREPTAQQATAGSVSATPAIAIELPGPWLKRMLDLREAGKIKELRVELARFRKQHPDVVLPKALTDLPEEEK